MERISIWCNSFDSVSYRQSNIPMHIKNACNFWEELQNSIVRCTILPTAISANFTQWILAFHFFDGSINSSFLSINVLVPSFPSADACVNVKTESTHCSKTFVFKRITILLWEMKSSLLNDAHVIQVLYSVSGWCLLFWDSIWKNERKWRIVSRAIQRLKLDKIYYLNDRTNKVQLIAEKIVNN